MNCRSHHHHEILYRSKSFTIPLGGPFWLLDVWGGGGGGGGVFKIYRSPGDLSSFGEKTVNTRYWMASYSAINCVYRNVRVSSLLEQLSPSSSHLCPPPFPFPRIFKTLTSGKYRRIVQPRLSLCTLHTLQQT